MLNQIPPPTIRLFVCLCIIAAIGIMGLAVCTENSNSDIMVMQSAKDRVGMDTSSSLNWARERRVLI